MSASSRPRNPYIAGKALGRDRGFFGRQDVFEMVESAIDSNAIVLFGQRRIGKTSILLQLERRLASPDYLPIYLDLMDRANRPVGEVLFAVAGAIAAELGWSSPQAERFDDEGVYFQQEVLPRLYEVVGERQRPVLLLDEFDVLDTAEEQRLASNAAANSFFPYLRRLMEQESRLGFVFVVGRKAEDLSIDVKAVFRSARHKRISVLDESSATELIRTAELQGNLVFEHAAVLRILTLTSGHPYFTQLLCGLLWDRAHRGRKYEGPPVINEAVVEEAVPVLIEAGENVFQWIWDGLPAAERVIFAAIAQSVGENGAISSDEILEILQGHGIRILTRELEVAPETLVEWEMLARREGGYGFFVEVLRRWVAERKPLPRVKDELDRIVPLADSLYRTGNAYYYQQGDAESALGQLHQALRVNPNHLKARLLVAEILTEQGDLEGALREFEEAYRFDEEAARFPLVRILLLLGEDHEREGRESEAIAIYERLLELSPRERLAKERLVTIWSRQGDEHAIAGDLEAAQAAYEKAGRTEKVAEICERREQALFEVNLGIAKSLWAKEQWGAAIDSFSLLCKARPEDSNLAKAKAELEEEFRLSNRYNEIVGLIQRQSWDQAISSLGELVHRRPDYKDAAELLVQALRERREATYTAKASLEAVPARATQEAAGLPASSTMLAAQEGDQGSATSPDDETLPGGGSYRDIIHRAAASVLYVLESLAFASFTIGFVVFLVIFLMFIYGSGYMDAAAVIGVVLILGSRVYISQSKARKIESCFINALAINGISVKIQYPLAAKVRWLDNYRLAILEPPVFESWFDGKVEEKIYDKVSFFAVSIGGTISLMDTSHRLYQLFQGDEIIAGQSAPSASIETDERIIHFTASGDGLVQVAATKRKIWLHSRAAFVSVTGGFHALNFTPEDPKETIQAIALSHDGALVGLSLGKPRGGVLKTSRHAVLLIDSRDGSVVYRMPMKYSASEIAFSPDGTMWTVATIGPGHLFPVPDASSESSIAPRVQVGGGSHSVAFSPDSRYLAAGNILNGLRIYDVRNGAQVATVLEVGFVKSVDFSPDGKRLVIKEATNGIAIFEWKKFLASGDTAQS